MSADKKVDGYQLIGSMEIGLDGMHEQVSVTVVDWSKEPTPSLWWLSFANGDLPAGTQFLGVAIVEATQFVEAVMRAHALGINPGGEVQGTQLGPEALERVDAKWLNRLLTKAECTAFDEEYS